MIVYARHTRLYYRKTVKYGRNNMISGPAGQRCLSSISWPFRLRSYVSEKIDECYIPPQPIVKRGKKKKKNDLSMQGRRVRFTALNFLTGTYRSDRHISIILSLSIGIELYY